MPSQPWKVILGQNTIHPSQVKLWLSVHVTHHLKSEEDWVAMKLNEPGWYKSKRIRIKIQPFIVQAKIIHRNLSLVWKKKRCRIPSSRWRRDGPITEVNGYLPLPPSHLPLSPALLCHKKYTENVLFFSVCWWAAFQECIVLYELD